jgi:hypothetical protein
MDKREVFRSNISAWTRRLGLEKPTDIDSVVKVAQKMGLDIGSRFTAMFVVASNYLLTKDLINDRVQRRKVAWVTAHVAYSFCYGEHSKTGGSIPAVTALFSGKAGAEFSDRERTLVADVAGTMIGSRSVDRSKPNMVNNILKKVR